jgi:hypothetical protein
MKNILKSVLCIALLAVMMLSFASCGKEHFGEFSYNGKWLTQYAKKALSAGEIKSLIQSISGYTSDSDEAPIVTLSVVGDAFISTQLEYPELPVEMRNAALKKYGCLEVSTRYYTEEDDSAVVVPGEFRGTDLAAIIGENKLSPFALVTAKNLILFDEVVTTWKLRMQNSRRMQNSPFPSPTSSLIMKTMTVTLLSRFTTLLNFLPPLQVV